jgi:hypothetical protein
MRRDSLLPAAQLAAVVTALYREAGDVGWATLSPSDRSRLYDQWVDEPRIGKILTSYMTPEAARSWIKDGPMKEYANARRGIGRYARFGMHGGTGPSDIVVAALGPGAAVVSGTEGVKPPHCQASTAAGKVTYLAWGEASNFRNLLWAALRAAVIEELPAHIVVLEPPGQPTPAADRKTHSLMAKRCRLEVHYVPETIGQPRYGGKDGP